MSSTEKATPAALGVREAVTRMHAGELTAAALVDACLDKIRALEPTLMAWAHVATDVASVAGRECANGRDPAVVGIPCT